MAKRDIRSQGAIVRLVRTAEGIALPTPEAAAPAAASSDEGTASDAAFDLAVREHR